MDIVEFYSGIVRDEKNSSIFYSAMAAKAIGIRRIVLENIAVECGRNVWILSKAIYSKTADRPRIKSGLINKAVTFDTGIEMAINEEEKSIKKIEYIITTCTIEDKKILNALLNQKNNRIKSLKNLKYVQ